MTFYRPEVPRTAWLPSSAATDSLSSPRQTLCFAGRMIIVMARSVFFSPRDPLTARKITEGFNCLKLEIEVMFEVGVRAHSVTL